MKHIFKKEPQKEDNASSMLDLKGAHSSRDGSRTAAKSRMECFVIIVNGFQPLTIITKLSILDVAVGLVPPLTLSRITPFMKISKRHVLINSFFISQFNYCPLMLHSRSINNKINRLQERVLRIVYNDFKSSFKNLLEKDGTVSIHVKNLQKLSTEMFKISKNFSVPPMSELFYYKVNHCDLRNPYEFSIPNVNSVFHGQASIKYLSPIIWQLVPSKFKDLNTASAFKAAIRKWKPNNQAM